MITQEDHLMLVMRVGQPEPIFKIRIEAGTQIDDDLYERIGIITILYQFGKDMALTMTSPISGDCAKPGDEIIIDGTSYGYIELGETANSDAKFISTPTLH